MANTLKLIVSAVGTVISYLTGGWSVSVITLIVFLAGDYITGVACAFVKHEVSSQIGFKGLAKKCMVLVMLIIAVMLDRLMGNDMWLFRSAVCYFYIANEGISMLENIAEMGVPVPKKLLTALGRLADVSLREDDASQEIDFRLNPDIRNVEKDAKDAAGGEAEPQVKPGDAIGGAIDSPVKSEDTTAQPDDGMGDDISQSEDTGDTAQSEEQDGENDELSE